MAKNVKDSPRRSLTKTQELARYNLEKFINYQYKSVKHFLDDWVKLVAKDEALLDEEGINGRRDYAAKLLRGEKGMGSEWQSRFERLLDLPRGSLLLPRMRKLTAYVLVNCRGKDAQLLYSNIQGNPDKWPEVDECAMVSGSSDLFIRIHGAEDRLTQILTEDIYNVSDIEIQGTNTLFSFSKMLWQRYPIENLERSPEPPYWLPKNQRSS